MAAGGPIEEVGGANHATMSRRDRVVHEIVDSEERYVAALNTLVRSPRTVCYCHPPMG